MLIAQNHRLNELVPQINKIENRTDGAESKIDICINFLPKRRRPLGRRFPRTPYYSSSRGWNILLYESRFNLSLTARRRSVRLRRTPRGAEPPRRGTSRGGDAPRHRHETSEKLPIQKDSIIFTIGFEFATVWCKDFCVYPEFSSKKFFNFFFKFFSHFFQKFWKIWAELRDSITFRTTYRPRMLIAQNHRLNELVPEIK